MTREEEMMSQAETKTCQSCKVDFTIEPDDFVFYAKMDVPAPTWCPSCRMQRRMTWRNERALYRRDCDLCKRPFISIYDANASWPVYCRTCWYSDGWDATTYAQDYSKEKPFLAQLQELHLKVPRIGVILQGTIENSDYTNCSSNNKDSYLVFASNFNESCAYGYLVQNSNDCYDNYVLNKSELCYGCIDCFNCYEVSFSMDCSDCRESWFLFGCRGATNCFMSSNLVNKQYYIRNKPFAKENYEREVERIRRETPFEQLQKEFQELRQRSVVKAMSGIQNSDVSGDWLYQCKNVRHSYRCLSLEDSAYCVQITEAKDCMDYHSWGRGCEFMYEVMTSGYQCYDVAFTSNCWEGNRALRYCISCHNSSDLFGCVGLKKQRYCILNKQYTEAEYQQLVAEIRQQMMEVPYTDRLGRVYRYGEYFPPELSPFAYNESLAQEYFPLAKELVLAGGYQYITLEPAHPTTTKKAETLPSLRDLAQDQLESLIADIIECQHRQSCNQQCTFAFKLQPKELIFLVRYGLPLPTLCPNCRHYERLGQLNTMQLWDRQCMCAGSQSSNGVYQNQAAKHKPHSLDAVCPNTFETTHSPQAVAVVYCEDCYQQEVV